MGYNQLHLNWEYAFSGGKNQSKLAKENDSTFILNVFWIFLKRAEEFNVWSVPPILPNFEEHFTVQNLFTFLSHETSSNVLDLINNYATSKTELVPSLPTFNDLNTSVVFLKPPGRIWWTETFHWAWHLVQRNHWFLSHSELYHEWF